MPVLNEERSISEALERVLVQTVTDLEVVVADGGSDDRTRELVLSTGDPRVRLIDNPGRLQGAGLNEALAVADGEVIIRLDGRSFIAPDYVARCLAALHETGAAVVGGRMVAWPEASTIARGIAVANEAWWGAGPARFHRDGPPGPADTVYLGAFRRSWLQVVGGWAEDVGVNEDFELNHRIRAAGGVVWYDPGIEVGYRPRASVRALAHQYLRYGRSKATVIRRHPRSTRPRQVLPAMVVPVGVLAATTLPGSRWALLVLLGHAGVLAALAGLSDGPGSVRANAGIAAWIMHWAWSAGFWFGMLRPFPPASRR